MTLHTYTQPMSLSSINILQLTVSEITFFLALACQPVHLPAHPENNTRRALKSCGVKMINYPLIKHFHHEIGPW